MRRLFLVILPMLFLQLANAQQVVPLWKVMNKRSLAFKATETRAVKNFETVYQLDAKRFKAQLRSLSIPSNNADASIRMALPVDAKRLLPFQIKKSNILHPELAKRYPTIQAYEGNSPEDPTASVRMEVSHKGIFIMIWQNGTTTLLQPFSDDSDNLFVQYKKRDIKRHKPFHCGMEATKHFHKIRHQLGSTTRSVPDGQLRRYRLALACTGEYTEFHGGTTADALAAMVTTINRVNGILKRELSLELEIVANNDRVIFLNAETDPYENDSSSQMLSANQDVCDELIGVNNYDIGHVFSTGGGGVAYLNSACFDAIKAGGVTGQPMPIGDVFDVDFVIHELGHQFGATHTQNNDCNRSFTSAFEPGSGSTIMGYSGICFPNVQENSDAYFHGFSLQQIVTYITGAGESCATLSDTGNEPPVADAGRDYFVPIGTPFELVGSAADANEEQTLTYNWEQMDNEIAEMPPNPTATEGPSFRSLSPKEVPNRYFPSMNALVGDADSKWEVLPMVGRSMRFRLTVRDNAMEGGCTDFDEMELTFIEDAGPFRITIPSEPIFYAANSTQTVRWEVANTTRAPINVDEVDILLSTDGGYTYPIVLAEGVPNDGVQDITLPDIVTDEARIKISGVEHIFFDISDNNFSITETSPDFEISVNPSEASICRGNSVQFTVNIKSVENFNDTVALSSNAGSIFPSYSFSNENPNTGENSILTINTAGVDPGNYTIEVTGTNGDKAKTRFIELSVSPNGGVAIDNISPANGEDDLSLQPTFEWAASDETATYELQVATDPNFTQLVIEEDNITETQYVSSIELAHNRTYFWRVRAINECGASDYSTTTQFTISNILCTIYTSADIPEIIPEQGTPEISSILELDEEGVINSVRVLNIEIAHSWINDLTATLQSPDGSQVVLFDQICGNENIIDLSFGQEGLPHNDLPCPPESTETIQPSESLDSLLDQPITGTWTLLIKDHFNLDGGRLNNWALEICKVVKEAIPLAITISDSSEPSCAGGSDGTILTNASGGTLPYSYQWSNGATTSDLEDIESGMYSVTVSDAAGSSTTMEINLGQPATINVTANINQPTCAENADGNISLEITGGTTPYQYVWAHGPQTVAVNNLSAGNYMVTVTDANRCAISTEITVEAPTKMQLTLTPSDVMQGEDGGIDLEVAGGMPPYTYTWSNNLNSQNISGLTAGDYAVTVTDNAGCTQAGSTSVEAPDNVTEDCHNVIVNVTLDNYGSETTWDIKNEAGDIVQQGGPYTNFTREEVQTATVCLPEGCYDFNIYDQWGDGICCNYGNGQYEVVEKETGEILVAGSEFQRLEKTNFCVPTTNSQSGITSYCGANGESTVYEWIEAVSLNGESFQTGNNGGYFNNVDKVVNIVAGTAFIADFTPGFGFSPYSENWQVWIDWNRDGDLEDEGEMVFFGSGEQVVQATIDVPTSASIGETKMRVAMKWGTRVAPCDSFNWGEVEDFVLNILPLSGLQKLNPTSSSIFTVSQLPQNKIGKQVQLFPNPVTHTLTVQWNTEDMTVQRIDLFDNLGNQLQIPNKSLSIASGVSQIPVHHLPNGVYFLQLKGEEAIIQKEFVVVK